MLETHSKPTETGESPQNGLIPFNIIRTETVLSKLPIHNLAKKGNISIHITRKNSAGQVDLLWKVSPSRDHGEPRQLAYKLDTIIINHRIEEQGRPLPELIRLGSLHSIAQELRLKRDTDTVRRTLRQNAGAFITAKLNYKAQDGTEQFLEADFTRYSVIFTGEKLPNGKKADAVYIELHPRYREVLNNAPVRPLNYDYLKELPPAAQRFYEIVTYKIFAALKYQHPEAKLSYSEYCTYSAQQRYLDWEHTRKQMYKVHRSHLKSGYLASVRYEVATDNQGQPDWLMFYTPGPKACAEYDTFNKKGHITESLPEPALIPAAGERGRSAELQPTTTSSAGTAKERVRRGKAAGATQLVSPKQEGESLVAALVARGIPETRSRELLDNLAEGQAVKDQLEWGDHLIQNALGKYRNPPGFYIHLIQQNTVPPDSFLTTGRRKAQDDAARIRAKEANERAKLELAYEDYRTKTLDAYIHENYSEDALVPRLAAKNDELKKKSAWLATASDQRLTSLARSAVRAEIAKEISFLDFESFAKGYKENLTPAMTSDTPQENAPPQVGEKVGETVSLS